MLFWEVNVFVHVEGYNMSKALVDISTCEPCDKANEPKFAFFDESDEMLVCWNGARSGLQRSHNVERRRRSKFLKSTHRKSKDEWSIR